MALHPAVELNDLIQNRETVGKIPLAQLAAVMNDPKSAGRLSLPAFQRDAVWDEARLSTLWDSLFRGFPVGSLLICPAKNFVQDRIVTRGMQTSSRQTAETSHVGTGDELLILDGQQRSIAIALGFRKPVPGIGARLWIDLKPGQGDNAIRFFVCTTLRPWGEGIRYDSLPELEALSLLGIANRHEFQKNRADMLLQSYPLQAGLPVPVSEWLSAVSAGKTALDPASLQYLHPALRRSYETDRAYLQGAVVSLHASIKRLLQYELPIQIVYSLQDVDDLSLAFGRLNSQGVTMGADDLFYSALKMEWPEFHDIVWRIYANSDFGQLMSPLRIVHLSIRIAMSQKRSDYLQDESDEPGGGADVVALNRKEYKRLFAADGTRVAQLIERLRSVHDGGDRSPLSQSLINCKRAILYDPGKGAADPGLPLPLIAQLDWHFWHLACAATYGSKSITENTRLELIRLALYMHFFSGRKSVRVRDALTRTTFRAARELGEGQDLFETIYRATIEACSEDEVEGFLLLSAADYEKAYRLDKNADFLEPLKNGLSILLYAQRFWLDAWYRNYDPASFQLRREDAPYDLDHIVPASSVNMRGKRGVPEDYWKDKHFWQILKNSPGNLRVWPKELNRSDQDKSPAQKFDVGQLDDATAERMEHYNLGNVASLLEASLISSEQWGVWASFSSEKAFWFENGNRSRFKEMTKGRALFLYEAFLEDSGLLQYVSSLND